MNLVSIAQEISTLREKGRYRCLRRVSTPQDAVIAIEGRKLLNFSSNNYLGLANHPEVVEAFTEYARKYGVGSGASRLIGGRKKQTFMTLTEAYHGNGHGSGKDIRNLFAGKSPDPGGGRRIAVETGRIRICAGG